MSKVSNKSIDLTELKYFVILRLFPNWDENLESIISCLDIYNSLRLEISQMTDLSGIDLYSNWVNLHKSGIYDKGLEVYLLKDLSKDEVRDIETDLRTPIYPDEEVSGEILDVDDSYKKYYGYNIDENATYTKWMDKFITTLKKFEKFEMNE